MTFDGDEMDVMIDTIDRQATYIAKLKAKLAACEVQRDVAEAALEGLLDAAPYGQDWEAARQRAGEALALTPADAESIVAERDRLREAMEVFAGLKSDSTWDWDNECEIYNGPTTRKWFRWRDNDILEPDTFARQALAPSEAKGGNNE